jgi:hypothetical protein
MINNINTNSIGSLIYDYEWDQSALRPQSVFISSDPAGAVRCKIVNFTEYLNFLSLDLDSTFHSLAFSNLNLNVSQFTIFSAALFLCNDVY